MKYKIIGNKKIDGFEPGQTIEIEDGNKADSLVAAGHLEKIKNKPKAKKGVK